MGFDIRIPIDDLDDCGSKLGQVGDQFQNAQDISSDYNEAVGHPGLRGKLDDMASNWKDHRNDMLNDIKGLSASATAAGKTFGQVGDDLTASMVTFQDSLPPTPVSATS